MRDVSPKSLPLTIIRNEGGSCRWEGRKSRRSCRFLEKKGGIKGLMRIHNSCGNAVRCTTGSNERSPAILSSCDLPLVTLHPTWYTIYTRRVASHRDVPRLTVYSRDRLLIISRGISGCSEHRYRATALIDILASIVQVVRT